MLKRLLASQAPAVCLALALLPFLLLCFYNQPYLDDYAWATAFRQLGLWRAMALLYDTQNGRFVASFFLTAANPLSYGSPSTLGLASLLINLFTLFSLWLSLHVMLRNAIGQRAKVMLAVALFLLFVAIIPDIYSALYWFASQVTHHTASLFLLLIPVSVAQAHRATRPLGQAGWVGLALGGTCLTGGSSEVVTLLLGWLLAVACVISLARREYQHATVWASLLLLLAGVALLDCLAPGTLNRLKPVHRDGAGIAARLYAVWQPAWLAKAIVLLLWTPGTLLILIVPLLFQPFAARLHAVRPAGFRLPLLVSSAILLAGVFLGACLMQLEITTTQVASRCANVLLWWLLIGWLAACWAALPPYPTPIYGSSSPIRPIGLALLCFLLVPPVLRAWHELLVDAPAWNQQCQRRYALLRQAAQQNPHAPVQLAPIYHVTPRYVLVRGYDIAPTFNKPYNRDIARYFGVDSVRVDPAARGAAF